MCAEQRMYELQGLAHVLKASLTKHAVPALPELSEPLKERLEDGKPFDKVLVSGGAATAASAAVVADVLAACAHVKSVAFWGGCLGDAGLDAVGAAVRAAADHWFTGAKLLSLELVADGMPGLHNGTDWCATHPALVHRS